MKNLQAQSSTQGLRSVPGITSPILGGKIDGVASLKESLSLLLYRPHIFVDLWSQLLDSFPINRPVSSDSKIRQVVNDLDREGAAIMRNVVSSKLLWKARRDIDRMVEKMPQLAGVSRTKPASTGGSRSYPVHEYQQGLGIYRSHDPLAFSVAFANFLLIPELIEVAAGYLGTSWLYQAMIATRTKPAESNREGFAKWHHDARGRKLNIFLLLSDVPDDGPATIILKGSHRLLYSRARREKNFFKDFEVDVLQRRYGWEQMVCSAPAGSLVFFDSQALHLGRRSPHLRDVFQVNCMTRRRHLWPHEISAHILRSLDVEDQRFLLQRARLDIA